MIAQKSHRALIVGRQSLHEELSEILGGYGYFVEHSRSRLEGVTSFRAHKQSLVVLDIEIVHGFPERLFRFFRLVRGNAIVIVVVDSKRQSQVYRYLIWGAHDVLHLPLKRDTLNFTLSRASTYHRAMVRSTFYKNALYFALAMLPLWATLFYLVLD